MKCIRSDSDLKYRKLFPKLKMFLVYSNDSYDKFPLIAERYRLDILINDSDWLIRRMIANKGYGLDKLVNDPSWMVRYEVAKHGYELDKLVNDPDQRVRKVAEAAKNEIYK